MFFDECLSVRFGFKFDHNIRTIKRSSEDFLLAIVSHETKFFKVFPHKVNACVSRSVADESVNVDSSIALVTKLVGHIVSF